MKKATIIALEKSIDHWFDILEGKSEDTSSFACALCHRFDCISCEMWEGEKCPVYASSGAKGCENTSHTHDTENKERVREEVHFLISLLPKKLQEPYWYD